MQLKLKVLEAPAHVLFARALALQDGGDRLQLELLSFRVAMWPDQPTNKKPNQ